MGSINWVSRNLLDNGGTDKVCDGSVLDRTYNCRSLAGGGHSTRKRYVSMLYQTINPATEEVVKTFPEHTDAQLQEIIAKAEAVYKSDWKSEDDRAKESGSQEGGGHSPREA